MQDFLSEGPGEYNWDLMDGLQGEDANERIPPDLQEKFKRAIIEGHIADEDWRGVSHEFIANYILVANIYLRIQN